MENWRVFTWSEEATKKQQNQLTNTEQRNNLRAFNEQSVDKNNNEQFQSGTYQAFWGSEPLIPSPDAINSHYPLSPHFFAPSDHAFCWFGKLAALEPQFFNFLNSKCSLKYIDSVKSEMQSYGKNPTRESCQSNFLSVEYHASYTCKAVCFCFVCPLSSHGSPRSCG